MSAQIIALHKAIRIFKTQRSLAKEIGVSNMVLNSWLNSNVKIPFQHAVSIEIATEGKVMAAELSPHIQFKYKGKKIKLNFTFDKIKG